MSIQAIQTEQGDENILIQDIRDIDALEIKCLEPKKSLHEAVKFSINISIESKTVYVEDELMCIYGLLEISKNAGIPWMLATNKINKYPFRIAKHGRKIVKQMTKKYNYLYNVIHSQNIKSQRFLKFCGFKIDEEPILINNENFYYFNLTREF